jgi:hypothetical protein
MSELNIPNLQDFISLARNNAFARRNRFLVEFFPPTGTGVIPNQQNVIGMLCEEANFPGKSIETRSLRINALTEQRAHFVDYKNKEITFKFIVDTTWQAKTFFDLWMSKAINPMVQGEAKPREVGYYHDYVGVVNIFSLNPIFQTDSTQNVEVPLYGVKLREAWPVMLEQQNMASGAEGYHRLTVGITFKWWEEILLGVEVPTAQVAQKNAGATVQDIQNVLRSTGQRERDRVNQIYFGGRGGDTGPFSGFGGGGGFAGGGNNGSY